jgi:exonuclease VII large subunit
MESNTMMRLVTLSAACLLFLTTASPAMAHNPFRDFERQQRRFIEQQQRLERDRQRLQERYLRDLQRREERFQRDQRRLYERELRERQRFQQQLFRNAPIRPQPFLPFGAGVPGRPGPFGPWYW